MFFWHLKQIQAQTTTEPLFIVIISVKISIIYRVLRVSGSAIHKKKWSNTVIYLAFVFRVEFCWPGQVLCSSLNFYFGKNPCKFTVQFDFQTESCFNTKYNQINKNVWKKTQSKQIISREEISSVAFVVRWNYTHGCHMRCGEDFI